MSSRIGIMNAGNLLQVGTPQEIYDRHPIFSGPKFVGTPSINLLAVTATAQANKLRLTFRDNDIEIGGAQLEAEPTLFPKLTKAD